MSKFEKYKLNPETLLYEIQEVSKRSRFMKAVAFVVASAALSFVFFWLFTAVFGFELPKTILLKSVNERWISDMDLMNRQLDSYDEALEGLGLRDDEIYRNIFGMNRIPTEVRNAGFGGVDRYSYLDNISDKSVLKKTEKRIDVLTKKAFVQSRSYDDVEALSQRAGDMASCRPVVPPILPDKSQYRLSSRFGYRSDPISGVSRMHTGLDFAAHQGTPVYAPGDGVVESVSFSIFGYGNSVVIDHGFGYKTRYGHLRDILVTEGMRVRRGQNIATIGNSGKSTGPHLHYEIMYKGSYVNPANFMDMEMPVDEYSSMVGNAVSKNGGLIYGQPGSTTRDKK